MIRGLYTAVSGLITQEAKQDVITNNLSNANTSGFKSDNLVVKSFNDVLIQNTDKTSAGRNVNSVIGSLSGGSEIDETTTDFSQGLLQASDSDTDFGLDGKGFFTVNRGSTTYYTRDGSFHVNNMGYLVNSSGDNVMGISKQTGLLEPIYAGNKKLTSDDNNGIYLDGTPAYDFNIADFSDYKSLQKSGDNLYSGSNPIASTAVAKQNTIEKSNVNVINEMVNMMTVMRTFESNQKVLQSMDETLGKAVNDVG
ncbi:MAG: flagellar hook-basal body complex protein, partial [Bacillota bacterium]|nr:flagellar hook-basal body complex protein [Bacillota bacterium]